MDDSTSAKRTVMIINKLGLHARAATKLVQLASSFSCDVAIGKDGQEVSGKSIMGVLMLVASQGTEITLRANGPQAVEAIEALVALVADRFGEDQ